jgi:hypothetical protein
MAKRSTRKVYGMKKAPSMGRIHGAEMRRIGMGRRMQGLKKGGKGTGGAC